MNHTSASMSEFMLHCAMDSQQIIYTTPLLTMVYLVTLFGNFLVILAITMNHNLQTPMNICIATLAVIDLAGSTNIVPKVIAVLLDSSSIPYGLCLLQMLLVLYLEGMESLLLALMACDRYVAVIHPLRYPSLITNKVAWAAILLLLLISTVFIMPYILFVTEFSFCKTNVLNYCFCDYITMVKLACNEDPKYLIMLSAVSVVFGAGPFAFIILSYLRIAYAALKIASIQGKKKVFNTLSSHLLVVGLFNIPLLTSYLLPGTGVKLTTEAYNTMVIVSIIVPPMLNPIIYSFRNKEIKTGICTFIKGIKAGPEIIRN
ncbi:olfactory receptor 1496-like [Erpetoichthys calabaricus]|uniref:olfactory receptor 1496-like n=1 Tax=Erpetoichthys calabaricus TaxID=27687 RepID=UPI00109FEAC4|nr:olfactory receptor 1496-like [Erpetoichthys calabaricus]